MTAKQTLVELLGAGAQAWVDDGQLALRAPAGGLSADLRARLVQCKSDVIELIGEQRRYALPSFAQQRLWLLDQLEPKSTAYNVMAGMRLRGALHVPALEASLRMIVGRHDVLRTHFTSLAGQPLQVIDGVNRVELEHVDLHRVRPAERERALAELVAAEARQPFDLGSGPLIRFLLAHLHHGEHALILAGHHSICDGWSMGVLARELAAVYPALARGGSPDPEPLPLQYADFATWQRQLLSGAQLERQLSYWRGHLGGDLPALELPTDRPRPPTQSYRGAIERLSLAPALVEALEGLSQSAGATLFMTLLASFQTLLQRYSGQDQVVVGTPIANRARPEFEDLIGLFVNTLVLRTDFSGRPSFRDLLGRVREVALGAYAHQDLPFERLVEELRPVRDSSRTPLFQVLFVMQNTPRANPRLPGIDVEPLRIQTDTAKFDLSLSLEPATDGLAATLEYATDLFEADTARRMLGHWQVLLEAIAANPDQAVADLPLLSQAERRMVVEDFNNTVVDYGVEACLHDLVQAQAERTPDVIAAVLDDDQLTYAQLDQRANQLAHHLRQLGVQPNMLVGVSMERSLDLVVALLGVLKAGAAYVPLDPGYPAERLAFMVDDARAPVLLTQSHLLERLPRHGTQVVAVDGDWSAIAAHPTSPPPSQVRPDDLAYVIFTSGSTGRPKGAMNAHRGIVNRLLWMQQAFRLTPRDRVLQKTPFSFDVSVWEFFWPLMRGARLVFARPDGHRDPAYLADLIRREGITTLHFVPSMLQVFLDVADLDACRSLRRVICSGEAMPVELQNRCLAALPWAGLFYLYGPTEAAIDVTAWPCQASPGLRSVPIGQPVANTQIYLLDENRQPVPIGVPGELYIGGVQVGLGYWRREELTAERFVSSPFGRLYRTGDLARWRPDGAIEYLGRLDHQIKLRGFRIELGEIETALSQYDSVNEAVVVPQPLGSGDPGLVAYVVPTSGLSVSEDELRAHLRQRLPDY
ncbi:MAG: amino acid adenylation domain-containing protein, partial [Chloroflexota bacterium]|nr:amino acid adenylation domain-containing protein [Chloroflexota bacterium]